MVGNDGGYTIAYTRWDDCKLCVAGRFKPAEEKDAFLNSIYKPDSGWLEEELQSIEIHDYNYILPY